MHLMHKFKTHLILMRRNYFKEKKSNMTNVMDLSTMSRSVNLGDFYDYSSDEILPLGYKAIYLIENLKK